MDINDSEVAALIANLDRHDKPAIRAAVDALIPLAAESSHLRELLKNRLADTGHKNYWPVAYILGHLPKPSGAVMGSLLDALDHREPDIRWAIALLLVRIAKAEGAVVNLLIELCVTGSANQKRMALYCIRDMALSDSVSLAAALEALHDADPTVRVAAAICLKLRPDLGDAGKHLLLQVYSNDVELKVRNAVAITLASLGSPSEEFLSALKKGSESDNGQAKKVAEAALKLLQK